MKKSLMNDNLYGKSDDNLSWLHFNSEPETSASIGYDAKTH